VLSVNRHPLRETPRACLRRSRFVRTNMHEHCAHGDMPDLGGCCTQRRSRHHGASASVSRPCTRLLHENGRLPPPALLRALELLGFLSGSPPDLLVLTAL
jgi:hypothetical protein